MDFNLNTILEIVISVLNPIVDPLIDKGRDAIEKELREAHDKALQTGLPLDEWFFQKVARFMKIDLEG